ncbi:glycine C-acetyltransferase [Rhizobium leguminosarum]|uniref:2-amino-3-ketobutyrate coenzyme A ligase n=1 Tax=Rhizobium leguminosarum bv. trifolii (strain WSM1325) TaxID=395491 RepID=C6ASH1_RHILS|nr:glycine C-acetyltransferase [Rhizobium leguminosarum]ACS57218.1 2-amino-3-ketobutyrate coenzyme A ligase [Rhizobium leguminosarum bv. trifolii WSM1325]MBY2906026.1 glycine C-acetyltransferase [Rhizobium leguminosarum]MBY2913044.1 glycine C-acetyltransferase [Rhizobium leguminosarum]MBY2921599.1 glycine C-acetyltransferase [Rhizobium leguminosarum]MBY2931251.1 glycine C-acetyltransferase [Rhizobium leguminosarum]
MTSQFLSHLSNEISALKDAGLYKSERVISSKQAGEIAISTGERVLNFCANNYLGLADNEELAEAGKQALDRYGYGMASVRFICGTQEEHKQLETRISSFLGMEDTILYSSCFDANGGLFETLLSEEDAIISDALNHASIIDGVRLSKAKRFRYANNDMAALEEELKKAEGSRFKLVATDGVFSMDGIIANLGGVCDLAEKYGAMVMVDDSHAVGFVGKNGRGSPEYCGVEGRIDIITGTLGKALGGASGGYTSAKAEVVEWLRQRSRPYLFSNTLAPVIAAASLKVFDLIEDGDTLRKRLSDNADLFRSEMTKLGFTLAGEGHPIIPVMLGDAKLAQDMASLMLKKGIYVIGFSFPVVPKGQARIRTQMSAAHSRVDVERAIAAFAEAGRELGVI